MARKGARKRRGRGLFWTLLLLGAAAAAGIFWLWTCLYAPEQRLHSILIARNGNPLRLLDGETVILR
ncbi:MAG: hypothetical protein ACLFUE_01050, partial [Desulfobacteraceae bacterium]